jgi:hypothetical protein
MGARRYPPPSPQRKCNSQNRDNLRWNQNHVTAMQASSGLGSNPGYQGSPANLAFQT